MIIAIIGPDGSGKTTYVHAIKHHLNKKNKQARVCYPFNYFILRKILNLGKNHKKNKKSTGISKNTNFLFKFWPIIALFDNWCDYLVNLRFYRGYTICERYYYDLATSFAEFGYSFDWLYKVYLALIPKADLCIVLNGMPSTLQKRETGEKHEIDFFKRQVRRYQLISKKFNFVEIDVNLPKEVCIKKIINIINENQ